MRWRILLSVYIGLVALFISYVAGSDPRYVLEFVLGVVLLLVSIAFAQDDGAHH